MGVGAQGLPGSSGGTLEEGDERLGGFCVDRTIRMALGEEDAVTTGLGQPGEHEAPPGVTLGIFDAVSELGDPLGEQGGQRIEQGVVDL